MTEIQLPLLQRRPRHLSEQYRTSLHTCAHFFRHAKGRPQVTQVFSGRSDFFTPRGIYRSSPSWRPSELPRRALRSLSFLRD